jgi:Fe-S cluster assembly ATP-binding protein
MHTLVIQNLYVKVEEKEILKGFDLTINSDETHVIMGPNGVGKSTLSNIIMGNPLYEVTKGNIFFDGVDITHMPTDERARMGLFLSFQTPVELEGVTTAEFLKAAVSTKEKENFKVLTFAREVEKTMQKLKINKDFLTRSFNSGFSGGEKKKMEILSMYLLKPSIVILDEIDSGLDVDSLKIIGENVTKYQEESKCGLLLITHYQRLLDYIKPDFVHIVIGGRIVKSGDASLVKYVEEHGYENFKEVL